MNIIFIAIGMFVGYIFLTRRELLNEKESFKLILGVSILLFIVGMVLHFTDVGRSSASELLLCPLPSLILYRFLRKLFVRWFKHEPRDTFLNWQAGLGEDRIFNIVFWGLVFILAMLVSSGVRELTKAGW